MTNTKRWLDELPLESRERELLLVGKSARPAEGAVDANWQALCVALSTTAAVSGVVATSAATNSISASASASAQVGSSLVASKLAGAGLLVAVTKSLAVGVAVGLAVMGAGSVAEHLSANNERHASVAKPTQAPSARRPSTESMPITQQPGNVVAAPAASLAGATATFPPPRERVALSNPALNPSSAPSPSPALSALSVDDQTASLSQQARELAELKRLIDSGATNEALRRLDKNFSADTVSVLSEERDALYVQALARAQRREEARTFARRFLIRYPHSPYSETMRQLLAVE